MKKNKSFAGNLLWGFLLASCLVGGTLQASSQEIQVRGTISDAQKEPLPGASIVVKGTLNGVITDIDGQYAISVPSEGILTISFVGMKTTEVQVNGQPVKAFKL
jgi:hypothetical protein